MTKKISGGVAHPMPADLKKLSLLIPKLLQSGRISHRSRATNGSVGLSPSSRRKNGKNTLSGYALS